MRSYLGQSLAGGSGEVLLGTVAGGGDLSEVLLGTVAGGGDRVRSYLGQSLAGVIG